MPWCPNCKTEYRFGIQQCTDCQSMLVEELPSVMETKLLVSFEGEKEESALNLLEFLKRESIDGVEIKKDEAFSLHILVPDSQLKRAEKILAVFTKMEAEAEFNALEEGERKKRIEEGIAKREKERNIHVYTKANERYKENVSTAWTFLITGILGLIYTLANILGYLSLMSGPLQSIIALLLFSAFIGLGLFSFTKNKSLKSLAKVEEDNEKRYKEWLTQLPMKELHEIWSKDASDEENEIVLVNTLSERLVKEFPELNENFADTLADEYFNEVKDEFIKSSYK